jgi:hypothetical protein
MGSLIGVLSTVILVSTVCTLIFAVGAYVISRKGRNGVGTMTEVIPGENVEDQFPHSAASQAASSTLFKRVQPGTGGPAQTTDAIMDDEYQWK